MLLEATDVGKATAPSARRWPIGAEVIEGRGVHFRVWVPRASPVEVAIVDHDSGNEIHRLALRRENDGYHSGTCDACGAGALYGFQLNGDERLLPDPMSRFQPKGPHGPSQVIDPRGFSWSDADWRGIRMRGQVLYEMH